MKILIATMLILATSLAGAETKAKQAPSQLGNNLITVGPNNIMTQPVDDDVVSMTVLLDIDGYLLNTLSHKHSGLDPEYEHVNQLYADAVNLYSAAIAKDGDMDFAEARKSANGLFVEEMLLLRGAK